MLPLFAGFCMTICLPSRAPMQWGKFHMFSKSHAMLFHSSSDEGTCKRRCNYVFDGFLLTLLNLYSIFDIFKINMKYKKI